MANLEPQGGIGAKRLVVGAHYGVGGFLGQRLTAVILATFTLILAARLALTAGSGYELWAGLFVPLWMKVFTLIALASLYYHAWIGVRDIWMDYVKSTWVRLSLQTLTVVWLAACAVWSVQILWSV